jgi:hypothetical protein
MASLVEYSILNGINNDLADAIESSGGDHSSAVGVVDLANIIRNQLISNRAVGEGIYDDWLFGSKETNNIWEAPTESTNAVQAKIIANSISNLYNLMIKTERFFVHLVDKIPTSEISLSSIYLLKHVTGEKNIVKSHIDTFKNITTFDGNVGKINQYVIKDCDCDECAEKKNTMIKVSPSNSGNVNALFGWDELNFKTSNFDQLVIKTNIQTWGDNGISYSFDGNIFYGINSDEIVLSKDSLKSMGVDVMDKIIFNVSSVNENTKSTELVIKDIYFQKEEPIVNYTAHYFIKEGKNLRRVDVDQVTININSLFYATREEHIELKNYYESIEKTLREQFGSYLETGEMSIENTLNSLNDKYAEINKKLEEEYIRWEDAPIATVDRAGWMSAEDKLKLDSIDHIEQNELENTLTL